jgi:hypothetical protein
MSLPANQSELAVTSVFILRVGLFEQ